MSSPKNNGHEYDLSQLAIQMQLLSNSSSTDNLVRVFFDSIPQLTWSARPDGFVDFYNRHFIEYAGYTLEELQGLGWRKLLPVHRFNDVLIRTCGTISRRSGVLWARR